MQISAIISPSFGKIYYGFDKNDLSRTQKDVLDDIHFALEENNYVSRLEKLHYDIYIEQRDDNYALDVAFLNGVRKDTSKGLIYDKIVMMGGYVASKQCFLVASENLNNAFTTDKIKERFDMFFRNNSWNKYKRYLNSL